MLRLYGFHKLDTDLGFRVGGWAIEDAQIQLVDKGVVILVFLHHLYEGVLWVTEGGVDGGSGHQCHHGPELHATGAFAFAWAFARWPAKCRQKATALLNARVGQLRRAGTWWHAGQFRLCPGDLIDGVV